MMTNSTIRLRRPREMVAWIFTEDPCTRISPMLVVEEHWEAAVMAPGLLDIIQMAMDTITSIRHHCINTTNKRIMIIRGLRIIIILDPTTMDTLVNTWILLPQIHGI